MAILPVVASLYAVFALSMASETKVVVKRETCDSGWDRHGSRCFKFFSAPQSWSEAEGECVKNGGHLASIHNIEEAKFVGILSANTMWTWIGGGGSSLGFTWFWTDGSPFDYSNWEAWEPNNYGGNEHCIATNCEGNTVGGIWNDYTCHTERPFVCAKK